MEQWFSVGLEMGFTGPQIKACTFDIPSPFSKLQALIEQRVRECGVKETETCLLAACEGIPQSIIGSVLEYLERGSSGMSPHDSGNRLLFTHLTPSEIVEHDLIRPFGQLCRLAGSEKGRSRTGTRVLLGYHLFFLLVNANRRVRTIHGID